MNKTRLTRILSVLLCLALVVAIACIVVGCTKKAEEPTTVAQTTQAVTEAAAEATKLGQGEKELNLVVKDADGKESKYIISTDAETVGAALVENKLIEGANGLYDTVNGKKLDYNADKMYWAFYIDGEYAQTGLDDTKLEEGKTYTLQAEQANF